MLDLLAEHPQIHLTGKIDRRPSSPHTFVQLSLRVHDVTFGDPDAWSLDGLVVGAVSRLTERLRAQRGEVSGAMRDFLRALSAEAVFEALHEWAWDTGDWPHEARCPSGGVEVNRFQALPLATEIFAGEHAYLVLEPEGLSRFVWRDPASKAVQERAIDGELYIHQWEALGAALKTGLSRV